MCELNFDREKREKNPKFIHTFLTHLGLQCPLMAAQVHTRCVRFLKDVEEQVKASLPRCKAKTPRGMRRKNRSRVVNKERIFFRASRSCTLNCSAFILAVRTGLSNVCIVTAVDAPVRVCVCVTKKEKPVFTSFV